MVLIQAAFYNLNHVYVETDNKYEIVAHKNGEEEDNNVFKSTSKTSLFTCMI